MILDEIAGFFVENNGNDYSVQTRLINSNSCACVACMPLTVDVGICLKQETQNKYPDMVHLAA